MSTLAVSFRKPMYSAWQLSKKYLHYYRHASSGKGHGIHSPFVFDFVKKVLNDKKDYPAYATVEALRKQLQHDDTGLEVEDMGAGSGIAMQRRKKVSTIARGIIKPKRWAQLLFRIVQYYQPATIVELGTSLGVTTCYLSLASPAGAIITLEGSDPIADKAQKNFSDLLLPNISLVRGNFDHTLPGVLQQLDTVNLGFVDGNHAKEPTLRYFEALLGKINSSSVIIFDDIHWSPEMEEAWEGIKAHPAVRLSIDLFFVGLVFFREDFKVKQHFVIRF